MTRYFSMMIVVEQQLLARTVAALGRDCRVVEVGSWLMGSAWLMSRANPHAQILCVDPFSGPVLERESLEFLARFPEFQGQRTPELARAIVRNLDNITILAADSPYNLGDQPCDFDLYFEDGNHHDPTLSANLDYWCARLKPGGLVALHDSDQSDVALHIERLEREGWQFKDASGSLTVLVKPRSGSAREI